MILESKRHNIVSLQDTKDNHKKYFFVQYPIAVPSNLVYSLSHIIDIIPPSSTTSPSTPSSSNIVYLNSPSSTSPFLPLSIFYITVPSNQSILSRSQTTGNIKIVFSSSTAKELFLGIYDIERMYEDNIITSFTPPTLNVSSTDQLQQYSIVPLYRGYAHESAHIDIPTLSTESFIKSLHPSPTITQQVNLLFTESEHPPLTLQEQGIIHGFSIPSALNLSNLAIMLIAKYTVYPPPSEEYISVNTIIKERFTGVNIPVDEAMFYYTFNATPYINLKTGQTI